MRLTHISFGILRQLIIAMVSMWIFHGIGHSMNLPVRTSEDETLSHRDSLIIEMVEFIHPDYSLSKEYRKHIENRIKDFPHKILRRDTVSHFLNTAYAITYYEFVKHDYKKAKAWGDRFTQLSLPTGYLISFFKYASVGYNASNSLTEKGKLKTKKDKNSWFTPIKLDFVDSLKWDFQRSYVDFLDSFLDDIPMDCSTTVYRKLLSIYHQGGGRLELLNGYTGKGFVQRCVDADRKDILNIIYDLWNVKDSDFHKNKQGFLEFRNPSVIVDSLAVAKIYNDILSYDTNVNKRQIDSLISIGSKEDLTPRIMRLMNQYYEQSRYKDLVDACEQLNNHVSGNRRNTLHSYWALGLSYLGRHEEALQHHDDAIINTTDQRTISTMRMNKACTLGEMGRTEEAAKIFMQEKEEQTTPFDKFVWNDNLGHIYSYSDPALALFYFNAAEKHLDAGNLYLDRKVRHFCRKARVLTTNPFLQREAIGKAMYYSRQTGCSNIAKGMAFTELATFISSTFNYAEADRLFQASYEFYKNLYSSDLRKIQLNRKNASNLSHLGCTEEAVRILQHQLEIVKDTYGDKHQEHIAILCQLVRLASTQPCSDINLESLYNELVRKKESASGLLSFEILESEVAYTLHAGRWQETLDLIENGLKMPINPMQKLRLLQSYEEISRNHLDKTTYYFQLAHLVSAIKAGMIEGLLTLSGEEERTFGIPLSNLTDGVLANESFNIALDLSLFRKGLLFSKKKAIERKFSNKRAVKKLSNKLKQTRKELNNAIAYNDSIHIPVLSATVYQLERELANRLSNDRTLLKYLDRTLSQVTRRLSAKDLAVEFIKYSVDTHTHYGAFLINKDGLIKFIRIGAEEEISVNPQIVWNWLADYLGTYDTVYFCPDGILNNIGVEFLALNGSRPLNQIIDIHRVFHLCNLKKSQNGIGEKIVVIGISDHNSAIEQGSTVNRGNWTDLPNVEYEIQLIKNALGESDLRVLLNDEATEPIVSAFSDTPLTTLHISTHGFYRNNVVLNEAAKDPSCEDYHIAQRFLKGGVSEVSGLVLRQGNISWKSPYILEEHDDLLTAEEIETMNFPSLNLTVLSACETGLGEVDNEGIWGLQRAFRVAGTKSLICALTKVDDYWTAQFMDAFYEQAAKGKSIYASFQSAQRWLRHELPDNPEIWSSFILIE